MGGEFMRDTTQIALTLAGIALVALLVSHSKETVDIVKGVGGTYAGLLQTVTLQNNYSNVFSF